jgi:hypothetical protein
VVVAVVWLLHKVAVVQCHNRVEQVILVQDLAFKVVR